MTDTSAPRPVPDARALRRGRLTVLAFSVTMLVLLLFVDGVTTQTIGAAGTGPATAAVAPLAGSNPVLVYNGHGGLVSHEPPPGRQIALSFDDGPNPTWTPKIARALVAAHVPATFFEVGAQVVRYPDVTRLLYRDHFQFGNHTFTHVYLTGVPTWERRLQVSLAQTAIAGQTGILPRLVRPPYSSSPDAVTPADERAWVPLVRSGYAIALSNYDTNDWARPGVGAIVNSVLGNAQIRRGVGGIVLMHDAGGNRAETVAALPPLIAGLRRLGYRFTTVAALAHISPGSRTGEGHRRAAAACADLRLHALAGRRRHQRPHAGGVRRDDPRRAADGRGARAGPHPDPPGSPAAGRPRLRAGGLGARPRPQRGGRHRPRGALAGRVRVPRRVRGGRRRRRLDRRHG